jgi:hypothetical protein
VNKADKIRRATDVFYDDQYSSKKPQDMSECSHQCLVCFTENNGTILGIQCDTSGFGVNEFTNNNLGSLGARFNITAL